MANADVVNAAIETTMDEIARAEQRLHEIDELQRDLADSYKRASVMRKGYVEAIGALRAANVALSTRLAGGRRRIAA